jgi:hypothetical protein
VAAATALRPKAMAAAVAFTAKTRAAMALESNPLQQSTPGHLFHKKSANRTSSAKQLSARIRKVKDWLARGCGLSSLGRTQPAGISFSDFIK